MMCYRHSLDTPSLATCAFYGCKVMAAHFQDDCQYSSPWKTILYPQLASDLRRFVLEWGVSLPNYWGVLIQWGGAYLGLTVGAVSACSLQALSWVTLSLCGRMLSASKTTLKNVHTALVTFSKAVLCMSRAAHPPQLHHLGD